MACISTARAVTILLSGSSASGHDFASPRIVGRDEPSTPRDVEKGLVPTNKTSTKRTWYYGKKTDTVEVPIGQDVVDVGTANPSKRSTLDIQRLRRQRSQDLIYALQLHRKVDKHCAPGPAVRFQCARDSSTNPVELQIPLEDRALEAAVNEVYEEFGCRGKPWAHNGQNCRVDEIVLIVDFDPAVPEDCFRDTAREMVECPTILVIQHDLDGMQIANHHFEIGIAYFIRRINRSTSCSCVNGEVAPFSGHNAIMAW
ncbi:hypothetical protein PENSPDRAFT_693041 [Peniophora sp. CONT]|nr:hypothetical protein PENSPDRAFT_693041 [Peniophora sp. CONT]